MSRWNRNVQKNRRQCYKTCSLCGKQLDNKFNYRTHHRKCKKDHKKSFVLHANILGSGINSLFLCEKNLKFNSHPSLKWLTFGQNKHDQKVKVVRVNGQITEVKQSRPRMILRWVTIKDPYMLSFSVLL